MARLIDEAGTKYVVLSLATIGRAPGCSVRICDGSASRVHARLIRSESGWLVEDLDSTNGLRVNDFPVRASSLRDGDLISIGGTTLRFQTGDDFTPPENDDGDGGAGPAHAAMLLS